MAETKIEWADYTFNAWIGCARVSRGCRFCLAPETRVLYADMTWRPIGEVTVGDVLAGFTENPPTGSNRLLERAVVQEVWRTVKPTVELTVGDRVVVASDDHLWLVGHRPYWRRTSDLRLDTPLRVLGDPDGVPDTASEDYRAGYIAGVTAGDGTMRWDPSWRSDKLGYPQMYWRVAVSADDRPIIDRLAEYLAMFGVDVQVRGFDGGPRSKPMVKVETRRGASLAIISGLLQERSAPDWMAGWLAGMVDSDGSYTGSSLRVSQRKDNGVLASVDQYAAALGFAFKVERYGDFCPSARFMGDLNTKVRFLARIQPALARKCAAFYGHVMKAPKAPVTGVRRGPVRELVDIQTSTGTFIAEGICTHNCYAEQDTARWQRGEGLWRRHGPRHVVADSTWKNPLAWNRKAAREGTRPRVFCASLADVFEDHPDVVEARERLWRLIEDTPNLIWMLLTKRPENVSRFIPERWAADGWPGNVWLGVSVESQRWAAARIPILLTHAGPAVRFLSCEPLVGPVDLSRWIPAPACYRPARVDWVIAGGESGRGDIAPVHPDWVRGLRDQAVAGGVPFLFKQWGGYTPARVFDAPNMHLGRAIEWPGGGHRSAVYVQERGPSGTLRARTTRPMRPGDRTKNMYMVDLDTVMLKIGKNKAGRELDGRTWDEIPA